MDDDLTLDLPARHRLLLDGLVMHEIACMPGWWSLLNKLCRLLQDYLDAHHEAPAILIVRAKGKWGGLRIYYRGGDEVCRQMMDKAMKTSLVICKVCGGKGKRIGKRRYSLRCLDHTGWSAAAFFESKHTLRGLTSRRARKHMSKSGLPELGDPRVRCASSGVGS